MRAPISLKVLPVVTDSCDSDSVNNNPYWLIGTPLLRNYYTIWNGRDLTLGFARPKWKSASLP